MRSVSPSRDRNGAGAGQALLGASLMPALESGRPTIRESHHAQFRTVCIYAYGLYHAEPELTVTQASPRTQESKPRDLFAAGGAQWVILSNRDCIDLHPAYAGLCVSVFLT